MSFSLDTGSTFSGHQVDQWDPPVVQWGPPLESSEIKKAAKHSGQMPRACSFARTGQMGPQEVYSFSTNCGLNTPTHSPPSMGENCRSPAGPHMPVARTDELG